MALNPLRDALTQAGLRAFGRSSAFQATTVEALDHFRALKRNLETAVRRGDLTPKVAREQAAIAAREMTADLRNRSKSYSSAPRVFRDRLNKEHQDRAMARESQSLDSLQRETNRLLRQVVLEQQIAHRTAEFEGRAFVKSGPSGQPAPSIERLLGLHVWSTQAGDEAAREWARRQLEAIRPLAFSPEEQRRIDLACDRADQINPRIVATYVEVMKDGPAEELEAFVTQAIAERDANACVAAFSLAREAPEGAYAAWVRKVLDGLREFPDAALNTLRTLEADALANDQEDAQAYVNQASAIAEAEARLTGVHAPTEAELARNNRINQLPATELDGPMGLVPTRRGLSAEEHAARQRAIAEPEQPDATN